MTRRIPSRQKRKADEYTLISAEDLDKSGLTRHALVMFALARGGDYDDGMAGCGASFALGLAMGGYGDDLVRITQADPAWKGGLAISEWRARITQELTDNDRGLLPHRAPVIATQIPFDFPEPTLHLYLHPSLSCSGVLEELAMRMKRPIAEPDIRRLAHLCQSYFHWSDERVTTTFHRKLWSAIALKILHSVSMKLK